MTIYLRFPDETTARSALSVYFDAVNGWITASLVHALDPVGTLYNDDGTPMEGWHVNFIGELPQAAQPYAITPSNPRVVFAS
jgi:hypothetical protein